MSLTPRLTMIGMYRYDPDLFHLLSLPAGMDRDLFINSLLMRYGENPVVFPSVPFFKSAVGVWSAKWYDSLERMFEAITENYNPLHNYDRHETYTDTEEKESTGSDRMTRSDTETATRTGSVTKNGTVTDSGSESSEYVTDTDTTSTEEKKISAENESQYQPDAKIEDAGTLDSTVTGEVTKGNTRTNSETESHTESDNRTGSGTDTRTTSGTDDRTLNHEAHMYGNIGVTTSQQMLMEEIKLRKDLSIYDVAAELFYREFCLYVY